MAWLIGQIVLFLVVAAIIGLIVGWLLRHWSPGVAPASGGGDESGADVEAADARVSECEAALTSARTELDVALADAERSATLSASLEADLTAAKDRMASLESDLEGARAHDRALDTLRVELEAATARADSLQAEFDAITATQAKAAAAAAAAVGGTAALEVRIGELQVDLDAARIQRSEARRELEGLLAAGDIPTLQATIAERDASVADLEGQLGRLAVAAEAKVAAEAEATAAAAASGRTVAELQGRISDLQVDLDAARMQRGEARRELEGLQVSFAERDARIGELEAALAAGSSGAATPVGAMEAEAEADLDGDTSIDADASVDGALSADADADVTV
ncbi:hypothetical protein HQ535_04470, partial [bacterium]|nr:hypothetical protein [bacterium]